MGTGASTTKGRRGQPKTNEARCRFQEETLSRATGGLPPKRPPMAIMPTRHALPYAHATLFSVIPLHPILIPGGGLQEILFDCFVMGRYMELCQDVSDSPMFLSSPIRELSFFVLSFASVVGCFASSRNDLLCAGKCSWTGNDLRSISKSDIWKQLS